jgi:Virulence-associated protein E-like domain/Bifunctional DNA primase/polymerase, N-terminal
MTNIAQPIDTRNAPSWRDYARWLASLGIHIFPLNPATKRPFANIDVASAIGWPEPPQGEGGLKFGTTDAAAIGAWWTRWPDALIGIRTGSISGLYVLDVDRKNDKDGFATINANNWIILNTVAAQTPSGGGHYYFSIPRGDQRRWKTDSDQIGKGLDRRGDNGYVVWYGADLSLQMAEPPAWMTGDIRIQNELSPHESRKPLGTDNASRFTDAVKALYSTNPNEMNYDDWRNISCAFRQSASGLGIDDAMIRMTWDGWCAQYGGNSYADNEKLWRSMANGTELGWSYLRGKASPQIQGELFFGQPTIPNAIDGKIFAPKDIFDEPLLGKLAGSTVSTELVAHIKDSRLPIGYDLFKRRQVKLNRMPWDKSPSGYPKPWTDDDDIYLQAWFHRYELKPSMEIVKYSARLSGLRNEFHPVLDYLNRLQWDGTKRLDELFIQYFNATNVEFARVVGAKFLIGMVARAYNPGCKRDEMIVLEGDQGIRKSTALNIIATDEYFSDSLPNLHDKDAAHHLQGCWLVEIGELAAMRRSEVEDVKRFVATRIDKFRPAYGHHIIESPRTAVFTATTNDDRYLKDTTGARRYWPIKCGTIDTDGLRRDRDQLFAEAVQRYRANERYWLIDQEETLAAIETAERREIDPWHDIVARHCAAIGGMPVSMDNLFRLALNVPYERLNASTNKRVAAILKSMGYRRQQLQRGGPWLYIR